MRHTVSPWTLGMPSSTTQDAQRIPEPLYTALPPCVWSPSKVLVPTTVAVPTQQPLWSKHKQD